MDASAGRLSSTTIPLPAAARPRGPGGAHDSRATRQRPADGGYARRVTLALIILALGAGAAAALTLRDRRRDERPIDAEA